MTSFELGQRRLDQRRAGAGWCGPAGRGGHRSARSAPRSAAGSCARILPLASSASTRGSRSPSIIAASIARAETVVRLDATADSLIEASSSISSSRIDLPGPVGHQLHPVAGQHPQPADVRRRHERRAAAARAPAAARSTPRRCTSVLRPRHRLHVRGVEQPHLHDLLQAVERRLPIRRGRLHRRDRHALARPASPASPPASGSSSGTSASHCPPARAGPACARTPSPTPCRHPARRPARTALPSRSPPLRRHRLGVARRALCQDTDPRARSSNQGAPEDPAPYTSAGSPAPVCADVAGRHPHSHPPRAAIQDRKPIHLLHPGLPNSL